MTHALPLPLFLVCGPRKMPEFCPRFVGPPSTAQNSYNGAMRIRLLYRFAAVCLLAFTLCQQARAEDAAAPSPSKEYKGREIAQTMHYFGAPWLTRESREREEDCKTMLAALQVKPGDTVCDMGCGNGFYTLKLAK